MRKQVTKEQFANSTVRRALGFGNSGVPSLMGLIDLIPGQIRMMRDDGNTANRFELLDWATVPVSGLSGGWSRGPDWIPVNSVQTIIAFITGLAEDGSEGYSSIVTASFRRGAAGDEQIIGVSTKLFEAKDNVTGDSEITGNTGGTLAIGFDSGQLVLQYTWSIKAIVIANTNS